MLTRRKKLNILYLCMGIVIGAVITALVAYFGVIANFTKERIVRIQNVFPASADSTAVHADITQNYLENEPKIKQQTAENNILIDTLQKNIPSDTISIVSVEKDTLLPFTIKSDMKISDAIIPIKYSTDDTLNPQKPILRKGEMMVELWENPTNFAGYRKYQNKLIVYGIDIKSIEFQLIKDSLFLVYNNKKLYLKDSDNFVRYPKGFIK